MTTNATLVSGPIGPDTIGLPGEPSRLRDAAQGLHELARQVEQTGQQLQRADPPEGARGRTVLALSRGAQRIGSVLEADARQLGGLADAIDTAADALAQGQDGVDGLRQRWRQARETFRSTLDSAKDGPKDVGALMHRIDATASEPHENQFRQQAGLTFLDGGGGAAGADAMLLEQGGRVQQAIADYRRETRAVVDDLADLMQRAKNADREVEDRLPRRSEAHLSAAGPAGDGDDPGHADVSAPSAVQTVGEAVQDAAQTLQRAVDQLEDVRLAVRAGRMLPDDERTGSNDGFKRDWTEHLDGLRESLQAGRRAADTAVERLRQIDADGAGDIRQALRDR